MLSRPGAASGRDTAGLRADRGPGCWPGRRAAAGSSLRS